jgi:hypothetical protein
MYITSESLGISVSDISVGTVPKFTTFAGAVDPHGTL